MLHTMLYDPCHIAKAIIDEIVLKETKGGNLRKRVRPTRNSRESEKNLGKAPLKHIYLTKTEGQDGRMLYDKSIK